MKMRRITLLLLVVADSAALPPLAMAQSLSDSGDPPARRSCRHRAQRTRNWL
jgi:hypothetical protein